MAVFMPMSRPRESSSAPPELPGLIAALRVGRGQGHARNGRGQRRARCGACGAWRPQRAVCGMEACGGCGARERRRRRGACVAVLTRFVSRW
eukprot:4427737-Prymnesium_polylepis.1